MISESGLRQVLGELEHLEELEVASVERLAGKLPGPPIQWVAIFLQLAHDLPGFEELRSNHFSKLKKTDFETLVFSLISLNKIQWLRLALRRGYSESAFTAAMELLSARPIEGTLKWERERQFARSGGEAKARKRAEDLSQRDSLIREMAAEMRSRGLSDRAIAKHLSRKVSLSSERLRKIIRRN